MRQTGKKIVVIGGGYVGLVSAACWAKFGHHLVLLERDAAKVKLLQQGRAPFFEPELDELLLAHLGKNLCVETDLAAAIETKPELIFLCVGTPPNVDGSADLSQVWQVVQALCAKLVAPTVLICKSTLPPGTCAQLQAFIQDFYAQQAHPPLLELAFVPEFLSQGQAVQNFLRPDRIVVGVANHGLLPILKELHAPLLADLTNFLPMDFASAELVKYAANAMLAVRISFINEIASFAAKLGGDIQQVASAVGADPRIGPNFLAAGLGFGGSCLPKDLAALAYCADQLNLSAEIVKATLRVNFAQRQKFLDKILQIFPKLENKNVGLVGLAFKPGTDDLRESPAVWLAGELSARGATVLAFDPLVTKAPAGLKVRLTQNFAELLTQDFLVVANKFDFLSKLLPQDFLPLKVRCIFDGRNSFPPGFFAGTKIQCFGLS